MKTTKNCSVRPLGAGVKQNYRKGWALYGMENKANTKHRINKKKTKLVVRIETINRETGGGSKCVCDRQLPFLLLNY